jgi:plastocyanin
MSRLLKLTGILALTAAASVAAVSVASAGSGPAATAAKKHRRHKVVRPVKVKVADDYFAPTTVKIKKGRSVKWVWDQFNYESHNVRLTKTHPKRVKRGKFRSVTGTIGIRFQRKFTVPGRYLFICTIHPTVMRMTVRVHK